MLIAVYGTLKKGLLNHNFLIGSKLIKEKAVTDNRCFVMTGANHSFPTVLYFPGQENLQSIEVEIYDVSKRDLVPIDSLEGHPHWYTRMPFSFEAGKYTAEMYIQEKPAVIAKDLMLKKTQIIGRWPNDTTK